MPGSRRAARGVQAGSPHPHTSVLLQGRAAGSQRWGQRPAPAGRWRGPPRAPLSREGTMLRRRRRRRWKKKRRTPRRTKCR